jgi:hypothetical protein
MKFFNDFIAGGTIFIKFRDLEGLNFRHFLAQFLTWFVAQESTTECLTYVGDAAGLIRSAIFFKPIYILIN